MKQLTVVICLTLFILKLKGFDCVNTTLIIPPSKYALTSDEYPYYGGASWSKVASLSSTNPVDKLPLLSTVSPINYVSSTKLYVSSSLPPSMILNFLTKITSSPSYLQSIEPSTIISLIETLCSSSSLLKVIPNNLLVDFITTVAVYPKLMDLLLPSTIVQLLNKIQTETPNVLCYLSPAVRVLLIHSVSSPEVLNTLSPTEISSLVNIYLTVECTLAQLPPSDPIELLKAISSSPVLMDNIPTSQTIDLLYQMSKLTPSLLCAISPNVTNALLSPMTESSFNQSPTTLLSVTTFVTSSPYIFNTINPSILSYMLIALSQPNALCTIPTTVIVKLLTDLSLSKTLIKTIKPEAIISILSSMKSMPTDLVNDLPPSVRSTFMLALTDAEVTSTLSIQMSVKLIDTLSNIPSFLVELPSCSINKIITFIVSNETLLNTIPSNNIVGFLYNITVLSPSILRETPPDDIRKLLSPLNSTLSSLRLCDYAKLLTCFTYSPFLMNVISKDQLVNILITLNSSQDTLKEIPCKIYSDVLTQIFTTPELLSKIPLTLLLNLLNNIQNSFTATDMCTIPSSTISAFVNFLVRNPTGLASLPLLDMTSLISILAKFPNFLAQMPIEFLNVLLDLIVASSTIFNVVPTEIKIKLVHKIYSLSPSIFCSLSQQSIRAIINSFSSFEALSSLSLDSLIELTTDISECPCLLSVLDGKTITNMLDVLSTSPSTLGVLKPRVIVNLMSLVSSSDALSTSVPTYSYLRFLRALSAIAPCTLCSIPTSVYAALLNPLKSMNEVNALTSADVKNVIDVLVATPCLLRELPRAILVNLLTAISETFTALPYEDVIALLYSIHSVAPSLPCIVPENVLADILEMFGSRPALSALPPERISELTTALSRSPCLLDAMPSSALNSFLDFLSSSPKSLKPIPFDVFADLLTKLALTPSTLKRVKLPRLISLLSAVSSLFSSSACALPPMVVYALLVPLSDAKTIYELDPTDVISLLNVATLAPCVLGAISGTTLNMLVSKVASSPDLLTRMPPSVMLSFFTTITASPSALSTVQPLTLINLMTTIALKQPSILSALPSPVTTTLLNTFNSQQVFASLPSPVIDSLIGLLLNFSNLFAALPLSALNSLILFLSSSPDVLGALPSCTLVKFLTTLSSLPPLLGALSPCTLTSFIATLSTISPKFICTLPSPVVMSLLQALTSTSALASSTPASIASLISTLNRSSCLITIFPTPILFAFLTYLTTHPYLLNDTPQFEILDLINNIRLPGSVPCTVPNISPCTANNFDFNSFTTHSPVISPNGYNTNTNLNSFSMTNFSPKIILPDDTNKSIINTFSKINKQTNSNNNGFKTSTKTTIDLILPTNAKGAQIHIFPKNNK